MGATSGSTGTADRGPAGIDKIRLTILPTGTMHGDLTWLLIDPGHMATSADKHPPRDWVEVPTYVVYIEHPDGTKLLWDTGVPRDWEKRWGPTGMDKFFPVDSVTEDMWLDSRLRSAYTGVSLSSRFWLTAAEPRRYFGLTWLERKGTPF